MNDAVQTSSWMPIVTFAIVNFPFVITNIVIAKRKGKSSIKYGLLSLIPIVVIYLTFYLLSLTDKDLKNRIDSLITTISEKTN